MTLQLQISPDEEARLTRSAKSEGMDLAKYARVLLGLEYRNGTRPAVGEWEASIDALAQDVDPAQVKIVAAAQKPYSKSILAEKSGPPAWKQLPTWYQISENDHAIPPAAERMFAKQINATTISLPSSHASPLSHPNEVAQLILDAANKLTGEGK